MSAPTPASIQGGRVVRLLARSRTWSSQLLTVTEADALATEVRLLVAGIGGSYGMFAFRCGDGRLVDVRAREITSIELCSAGEAPRADVRTAEEIAESVVRP
jgi:hypothetical protein